MISETFFRDCMDKYCGVPSRGEIAAVVLPWSAIASKASQSCVCESKTLSPCSPLLAPRFTLHSPLSTLPLHSPLSTLHSPLSTLHSPLSTLHSPLSTLHCTPHSHSHSPHFTSSLHSYKITRIDGCSAAPLSEHRCCGAAARSLPGLASPSAHRVPTRSPDRFFNYTGISYALLIAFSLLLMLLRPLWRPGSCM